MIGIMTLAGPGAGRFPTANSVMNDLIRLSLNKTSVPFPLSTDIPLQSNYTTGFYVRIKCSDGKYWVILCVIFFLLSIIDLLFVIDSNSHYVDVIKWMNT